MSTLSLFFIGSGLLAVAFLALNLFVAAGRRRGVARNASLFKTGNPTLSGTRRRPTTSARLVDAVTVDATG